MKGLTIPLSELLGGCNDMEEQRAALPLPEAQVATLREVYERYATGCQFRPGDLVTPRNGFNLRGVGIPHIVLEVRSPEDALRPASDNPQDTGSTRYYPRLDVRVACRHATDRSVCAFWQESWCHEPYLGDVKGAA